MSLVRTESQLPTDTADYTKQDFRVRVPEFEVATENRPEEVKPLAKARTVILEEKCGAEFFSCGLIHTSFLQLSRPAVSMRRQRLRRRSGTMQKACFFLGVAQSTIRIVAATSHQAHCDLSECRTKEEAKLAELEKRSCLFDSETSRKRCCLVAGSMKASKAFASRRALCVTVMVQSKKRFAIRGEEREGTLVAGCHRVRFFQKLAGSKRNGNRVRQLRANGSPSTTTLRR